MNAKRDELPPPATGGLQEALQARLRRPDVPPEDATSHTDETRTRDTRTGARVHVTHRRELPEMDRRSWYMAKDDAATLARTIDDLFFATRRPKHEIMAAIVRHVTRYREELRDELSHP